MCLPGVPGATSRRGNCRDPADPAGPRIGCAGARQRVRGAVPAGQAGRAAGAAAGGLRVEDRGHHRAAGGRLGPLLRGGGLVGGACGGGGSWGGEGGVGVVLGVVLTEMGFLGHDAGHRQVFGTRRASYVAGVLLGNLGIGLSYRCWVDKHNRHHAHPNTEDADPDIAVGALAFTAAQARAGRGAARLVFRYQAYLFFPPLLGEAVRLHAASVRALTRPAAPAPPWERALITLPAPGFLTVGVLVLSPVP